MNYFARKMYFSIIASTLIIVTAATTSYAWYSTNQNAVIDRFNLNIYNSNDKDSDELKLSITGNKDDFHQYLEETDLERAVLFNLIGETETNKLGDGTTNQSKLNIKNMFNRMVKLVNATPNLDSNNKPDLTKGFKELNLDDVTKSNTTTNYISFDLYVAVENDKTYVTEGTTVYLDSYIENNEIKNEVCQSEDYMCSLLTNLPSGGIDSITGETLVSKPMSQFKVNAKNAMRMGYITYSPTQKGVKSETNVLKQNIYSLSSQEASKTNDVYNFGGLNGDNSGYNAMLEYYNSIKNVDNYKDLIPDYIKTRSDDYLYGEDTDKEIISKSYNLTTSNMIKIRFYFWLEGWDADCFNTLTGANASFSIYLSTKQNNTSSEN